MITQDAERLLKYMEGRNIDGARHATRGWNHIGALITDAVLQRRQKYKATVFPRVNSLIREWPDAETTNGFRQRIKGGELSAVIRWKGEERLKQIQDILSVFEDLEIQDVNSLRERLTADPARGKFRSALRRVRHVGQKTVDYVDILAGVETGMAVDSRIRKHMKSAGVSNLTYAHVQAVMRQAAEARGWRPGDLDAALWNAS